jgi:hypothetical protein
LKSARERVSITEAAASQRMRSTAHFSKESKPEEAWQSQMDSAGDVFAVYVQF